VKYFIEIRLHELFEQWAGEKAASITPLPQSGSDREYYRVSSENRSAIGAYNPDHKENMAFLSFSKHFYNKGLAVPKIYIEDTENNMYLLEDLGDITLFSYLSKKRTFDYFPGELIEVYRQIIAEIPKFQIVAAKDMDYSVCYPRASFDKQSMMWDVNYFKYYFLKLAKIPFDEQRLEDDFHTFTDYLLDVDRDYFLYRDFQSRNVMLVNGKPYFIDYQGGRRGALQYDLASLLYDGKADIPQDVRNLLLEYYIGEVSKYINIDKEKFVAQYYGYVIIRIMQAMGAYGFRGFYEKKEHFLLSIPYALKNIEWLLANVHLPIQIPVLMDVLHKLTQSDWLKKLGKPKSGLTVSISSFSYRKGIPEDKTGHGGGFVFDCRALHNPGRYPEYKQFTGKDKPVIAFFEKEKDVAEFLDLIFTMVDKSVDVYKKKQFTNLMVNFGCTGGQHRSVYCAERLAAYLKQNLDINVELRHREQEN